MKKGLTLFLVLCVSAALVWLAAFSWNNLRGIVTALRKPSRDILHFIERVEASDNTADAPLRLPPGFYISLFAKGLGGPRVMVSDPSGTMLVSIPSQGRVVALPDADKDGVADRVVTVIRGLNRPHGMAFRCAPSCKLYIAEEHQVSVYSYDGKDFRAEKEKKIADLPQGSGHSTRTLLFLPGPSDDQLLISVGSSCNVCREKDSRRAKVLVVPAEGGDPGVFASGLRNAVFMAIRPKTNRVWVTEMGRDLLGDNTPPDEINIIDQGRDYGWPFCFGKNVHDDDFDPEGAHVCRQPATVPSHIDIPAHSAPLGLAFFPEEGWPKEFRNNLLVSFHGSWNRSSPTG
ncbi:MAG TPA: PQQ-dependent sugar dehydrogenase, partial [Nitrospirota bacterium]|nr:PQQ-dependent sugar dehydrogenase [Nitrospirota bacterium]